MGRIERFRSRWDVARVQATFALVATLGRMPFWPVRRAPKSTVAILYPASAGSRGDDAILEGVRDVLQLSPDQLLVLGLATLPELDPGVRGARLPGRRPWLRYAIALRSELRGVGALIVAGADVLDGRYSPRRSVDRLLTAAIASSLGVEVAIVGCSWNDRPHPTAVRAMRSLPVQVAITSRDEVSRRRLEHDARRSVGSCADPAFAMASLDLADRRLVVPDRPDGGLILGLCVTSPTLSGARDLLEHIGATLRAVGDHKPLALQGLPHDGRGSSSDWDVLQDLSETSGLTIALPPRDASARELRDLASQCDLVITCRMHLAIGALSEGVATLGVGYQGKFQGLADHFGLTWVDDASEASEADLRSAVERAIEEREAMAAQIAERLPSVRAHARSCVPSNVLQVAGRLRRTADASGHHRVEDSPRGR